MTLLLIIFVVTMALSGVTYLVATRKLEERDSAKVRDRLVGNVQPTVVGRRRPRLCFNSTASATRTCSPSC